MPWTHITRFFRRKVVLFIILSFSLIYFLLNFVFEGHFSSTNDLESVDFGNFDSLIWHSDDESSDNSSSLITCRNSVQGKSLVVDDRGYVCSRFNVLGSGCCDLNAKNVRYSCETCKGNGCCSIYEFCVSCCLQPNKNPVCGVVVRRVPQDDTREKCRISSFLMSNLFKDDPMMIAAGMNRNDPDPGLIQYYAAAANQGKSIYAMIDMTREIIGVCLNRLTSLSNIGELHRTANRLSFEETTRYMQVLASIEEKANVYRSFNVEQAWSVECLCTGRNFRRRGISKLLLKQSREMALTESEAKVIKFACTNAYGARVAVTCGGMIAHISRKLTECRDEKGNIIIPTEMCPPHKNVELFVGKLNREHNQ